MTDTYTDDLVRDVVWLRIEHQRLLEERHRLIAERHKLAAEAFDLGEIRL